MLSDRGMTLLVGAILEQAVRDYRRLLSGKKESTLCNISELEEFFRSGWFGLMVDSPDITGDFVMTEIRKQVEKTGMEKVKTPNGSRKEL